MAGKYCVDCEHHQLSGNDHLCHKDAIEVTDVVTGEKKHLSVHDCYDEREIQYDTSFCSIEARHFKKKEVPVVKDIQQTNVPVTK